MLPCAGPGGARGSVLTCPSVLGACSSEPKSTRSLDVMLVSSLIRALRSRHRSCSPSSCSDLALWTDAIPKLSAANRDNASRII